jgi:hypothetical protein
MNIHDQNPVTRGRFLGRLGKTAAIGLGIALVPARALAGRPQSHTHCCKDDTCPSCQSGIRYRCSGTCPECCTCLNETQMCVDYYGGCIC